MQYTEERKARKLIITTGDTSDIDGLLAFAQYARSGADVLFIMNYPAYIGHVGEYEEKQGIGCGYGYSAKMIAETTRQKSDGSSVEDRLKFLNRYTTSKIEAEAELRTDIQMNGVYARALTDIAFHMCRAIWREFAPGNGKSNFYFGIGGVNSFLPFHYSSHKDETYLYAELIFGDEISDFEDPVPYLPGSVYSEKVELCNGFFFNRSSYKETKIYMDFNGSMAFLRIPAWHAFIANVVLPKLEGVYVMGGVYTEVVPQTMPSIKGSLSRLSVATMNQSYDPEMAAEFFDMLHGVRCFTVSNNAVPAFGNPTSLKEGKKEDYIEEFLEKNGLNKPRLTTFAKAYYLYNRTGGWKAFDLYTAALLLCDMEGAVSSSLLEERALFYDANYGMTLLSKHTRATVAVEELCKCIVDAPVSNIPFLMEAQANRISEIEHVIGSSAGTLKKITVLDVTSAGAGEVLRRTNELGSHCCIGEPGTSSTWFESPSKKGRSLL